MADLISLQDIFAFSAEEWQRAVVRFNDTNAKKDRPITDWLLNSEAALDWTYWRNHRFFDGEILISFFNITPSCYLLVAVDEIHGDPENLSVDKSRPLDRASVTHLPRFDKYIGRLVIHYKNQVSGGTYSYQHVVNGKILPQISVKEILPERYGGEAFPGYEAVNIGFKQLVYICKEGVGPGDWRAALANQMGVYLITDTKAKKLYVGSAYGGEMLLQRWSCYADTCHGGNKLLKELYQNEGGKEYFENYMRYSILEHWGGNRDANYAIARENHWKKILLARDVGYNAN